LSEKTGGYSTNTFRKNLKNRFSFENAASNALLGRRLL
jgi:hypothetical protein